MSDGERCRKWRDTAEEAERQRDIAIHNAETVARNATTSGEAQRRRIAHLEGALRELAENAWTRRDRHIAAIALTPQETP